MREAMTCACGAKQTKVAYSPTMKGVMFACVRNPNGCRSQEEGTYPTEKDGTLGVQWYAEHFALDIAPAGSLDCL